MSTMTTVRAVRLVPRTFSVWALLMLTRNNFVRRFSIAKTNLARGGMPYIFLF